MKRVLVDMSVTLLHHGHLRLLQKAKELGHVIVALTTDEEIIKHKGYHPELSFEERKELLLGLRCVDEVVPCTWKIDDDFLKRHNADVLVHSGPNFNEVSAVVNLDRTEGISSSDIRERSVRAIVEKRNSQRCLMTPGPTNLHAENLLDLWPAFTRGDEEYTKVEKKVLTNILKLAGQDSIAALQGSATTAIEVATTNFLTGRVAVVTSGYYSGRMLQMLEVKKQKLGLKDVIGIDYDRFLAEAPSFGKLDWVLCAYTETADAFLADLPKMRSLCDQLEARLMVDATGSINLEKDHHLADVNMFSSCKGLGGLAGAGFITFGKKLLSSLNPVPKEFILDLTTYIERKTTAPVHAISSLNTISENFEHFGDLVRRSKEQFCSKYEKHLFRTGNQPALCTKLRGVEIKAPSWILTYGPRTAEPGTAVVCHLFDQFPSSRRPGELYQFMEVCRLARQPE